MLSKSFETRNSISGISMILKKESLLILIPCLLLFQQCEKKGIINDNPEQPPAEATGKPVSIILKIDTTYRLNDGSFSTLLNAYIADSAGRRVRTASIPLLITVEGDAEITGTGNGIAVKLLSSDGNLKTWSSRITGGLCPLVLWTGTGEYIIRVDVKNDTLNRETGDLNLAGEAVIYLQPSSNRSWKEAPVSPVSIGADISSLPQIEAQGRRFFENGKETDPVRILADNGLNAVRLRIFVNPENAGGYSPGEDYCGLEQTLAMAARVKKYGMKLLIDFHYSDYWADPSQQNKPLAWKNLDFSLLKDSVKSYTHRVIKALGDQGTLPDIVQTGNEINHGMLWPDGNISSPDSLAQLIKAAVDGVKSVDPSIKIMMHLALGGQNAEARYWLDNMISRGVSFDIIGLSYYPQWHGTLNDLMSNLTDLAQRYGKKLDVVEYDQDAAEINNIVFSLPGKLGEGSFNWEPLNRFFDSSGNPVQALFDYKSLALKYLPVL